MIHWKEEQLPNQCQAGLLGIGVKVGSEGGQCPGREIKNKALATFLLL